MKRYLFLLIIAISCLSINTYAQDLSLDVQKEAKSQRQMMHKNNDGIFGDFSAYYNSTSKFYIAATKLLQQKIEQLEAYLNTKSSAEVTVDEATGITTITWSDGAMYRGQTYLGEIKGVGTMIFPDGSKYCGQWERDLPNGDGTMLYPDGLVCSANFVNGLPHGKGVVEDADGNKFSARWVHGKLKKFKGKVIITPRREEITQ